MSINEGLMLRSIAGAEAKAMWQIPGFVHLLAPASCEWSKPTPNFRQPLGYPL